MATPPEVENFRIETVLGSGAMGVVYRALQTAPVRRHVALKVLKRGADAPDVLARFANERQALARMDHPGIARIFDAGTTKDGQPYFAMELVQGTPLLEFCNAARLTIRQRLRLFAGVCRAVQHAHQKGVVHRDLKPSNILVATVDGEPVARIIDFGIAKATVGDGIADARLTQDDQVIGSPAYMSPEQINGSRDLDTRADIYSLGIVLYEVLVGALPFPQTGYRGWAAIAQALQDDAPPPSRRFETLADTQETVARERSTTPARLRRALGGDLDWIVGRATERDPDDRYESAVGLALDIERHLADEPIRAPGASAAYRVRKFVRRHRWGVGFAATIAVGLTGFAVVTSIQADRIAEARDLAQTRQGQAEGLIGFMIGDLADRLDGVGRLDLMDTVAVEALAYFDAVDPAQLSDEELFRRAQAVQQIGEVRGDQGEWVLAGEAFGRALDDYRALASRDPERDAWQLGLGEGLFYVGLAHRSLGRGDSALAYFRRYRDVALRNADRSPDDPVWQGELASTATNVALQSRANGDLDGVVEGLRDALRAKQAIHAADPSNADAAYDLAQGWYNFGIALSDVGSDEEALAAFESGVSVFRDLLDGDPLNERYRTRLVSSLGRSARTGEALGRSSVAIERMSEVLEIADAQVARDPTNVEWAREAAAAHMYLGSWDEGRRGSLDESVNRLERLASEVPEHDQIPITLARALSLRGGLGGPGAMEDYGRAKAVLGDYLARRPGHRSASENLARILVSEGDARLEQGDAATARERWLEARDLLRPWTADEAGPSRELDDALRRRLEDNVPDGP